MMKVGFILYYIIFQHNLIPCQCSLVVINIHPDRSFPSEFFSATIRLRTYWCKLVYIYFFYFISILVLSSLLIFIYFGVFICSFCNLFFFFHLCFSYIFSFIFFFFHSKFLSFSLPVSLSFSSLYLFCTQNAFVLPLFIM